MGIIMASPDSSWVVGKETGRGFFGTHAECLYLERLHVWKRSLGQSS
jgi:hypothetical protein